MGSFSLCYLDCEKKNLQKEAAIFKPGLFFFLFQNCNVYQASAVKSRYLGYLLEWYSDQCRFLSAFNFTYISVISYLHRFLKIILQFESDVSWYSISVRVAVKQHSASILFRVLYKCQRNECQDALVNQAVHPDHSDMKTRSPSPKVLHQCNCFDVCVCVCVIVTRITKAPQPPSLAAVIPKMKVLHLGLAVPQILVSALLC